jgi:hypothetical protein
MRNISNGELDRLFRDAAEEIDLKPEPGDWEFLLQHLVQHHTACPRTVITSCCLAILLGLQLILLRYDQKHWCGVPPNNNTIRLLMRQKVPQDVYRLMQRLSADGS